MAEQEIIRLFRSVETLQAEAGAGDNGDQSKIFRLYGMIEWLIRVNGDWILERMKDASFASRIKEGVEEAREQLGRAAIRPIVNGNPLKTKSFPKYLTLPRLVRENIWNFLTPEDLLSLAEAFPSEVQYFPQPLICLQILAVFPILIQKDLLEAKDVMHLSGVNSYVCNCIIKYYEDVFWKDEFRVSRCLHFDASDRVTLEDVIGLKTDYQVVSHVRFKLNRAVADDSIRLDQLRICGRRILDCALRLDVCEDFVERLQAYLELMPNLKTLSIEDEGCVTREIKGLVLPELRFLRNLVISEFVGAPALQRMLLRNYSNTLELITLHTTGEPKVRFQIDGTATSLTILKLYIMTIEPQAPMRNWYYNFKTFAYCPLKEIDVCANEIFVGPLLVLLGRHWKDTLEVLEIRFDYFKERIRRFDVEETTWMINLRFPKLRRFEICCYPLSMDWSFLLLFPALEELRYSEGEEEVEEEDLWLNEIYADADDEKEDNVEPFIIMPSDRNEVLRSNLWKLFPKLKKVVADGKIITRKECLVA